MLFCHQTEFCPKLNEKATFFKKDSQRSSKAALTKLCDLPTLDSKMTALSLFFKISRVW